MSALRVTHVITGLGVGGAETALARLLAEMASRGIEANVVSLLPPGPLSERITSLGVPVASLGLSGAWAGPSGIPRLAGLLRERRPHVVQTWMYHADLVGGLAARVARVPAVVWGVRMSDPQGEKRATRAVVRTNAALSRRVPDAVVWVNQASAQHHRTLGYRPRKSVVIQNGVPPHAAAAGDRERIRNELGVGEREVLVLRLGRYHPVKGYDVLVRAAASLVRGGQPVRFAFAGADVTEDNRELVALLTREGIAGAVRLLGARDDVDALLAAADVVCSPSHTEGFPNTVAEAMAAGVPVVGTAVGETPELVGDTGILVPPADADALAAGMSRLTQLDPTERMRFGAAARERVMARYSVAVMAGSYETLYRHLAHRDTLK